MENNRNLWYNKRPVKTGKTTNLFKKKDKRPKENLQKTHEEQIFNIYETWYDAEFLLDIDLENFNMNYLHIDVIKQIEPIKSQSNMTTLWNKAITHLFSGYYDTYETYSEIKNLEGKFNNEMGKFWNTYRNRLTKLLELTNLTPKEDLMNMLLRYMFCKTINHDQHPKGLSWQLNNFQSFIVYDKYYKQTELYNPFHDREDELISYLQNNQEKIIDSINDFQECVKEIRRNIVKFQEQLTLIVHNKIGGLKGDCEFEIKLSSSSD